MPMKVICKIPFGTDINTVADIMNVLRENTNEMGSVTEVDADKQDLLIKCEDEEEGRARRVAQFADERKDEGE